MDTEKLLYLGNWHKHLGYGGPSYGDHLQIGEFFTLNPHKNTVVSLIIDLPTENNHTVVVEVYRREGNLEEGTENSFQTFRIPESNISYYSNNIISEEEMGINKEQMSLIKRELVQVFKSKFTIEDIDHFIKKLEEI